MSVYDTAHGSAHGSMRRPGRAVAPLLPPEQEQSLIANLMQQSGGAIETIGRFLDTPASIARGALTGDATTDMTWDANTRVSGQELLDQYGVLKPTDDPRFRTAAGLAAEIALDPLTLISGPMRALTAGGKAARAAGILDKASDVATARMGMDAAAQTLTGAAARKWARRLAPENIADTAETYAIRPLIGPRQARATTTLDELVQFADKDSPGREAYNRVYNYLAQRGVNYDDVAQDRLGGAFGIGMFSPAATFLPPGGVKALDAMDYLGQKIDWSWPARRLSAMFDNRVADTIDPADQLEALKHSRYLDEALQAGRTTAARHAMTVSEIQLSPQARKVLGADSLLSEEGNKFLTRLFENTQTRADEQLKSLIGPDLDKAVRSWDTIRRFNESEGFRLGMTIQSYGDKYQVLYSPRKAAEADFGEYGTGLSRSQYNTRMLEQQVREEYLKTPGGTDDLRDVSLLPIVDDFARNGPNSQYSLEEVGKAIADFINNKHAPGSPTARARPAKTPYPVTEEQGKRIASFMQRLDKRRPEGVSMFSEHPVSAQARNIVSQHLARANAQYIYDSIAQSALNTPRGQLAGGFKSAKATLDEVARATGLEMDGGMAGSMAQANLVASISRRTGIAADKIDLEAFSVPEQVLNRLTRIQSFYSSPRAQQEIVRLLNQYSMLFKGFVLAWPSRFVRDMYSNAFSIWLENGSVPDTIYGLGAAKAIVRGNFDAAIPALKQIPEYASIADGAALKRKFMEDAAGAGILQTLASNDLTTANRTGELAQLVPGANPISRRGALAELGGDWSKFFQIRDVRFPWQSQAAYETGNPLLNASQKLSDFVDSTARLGGYISLLKQGVSPSEAARRMTAALVDYSSLTSMERNVFRAIFPWWAYNSRIGKYVVQSLVENPGGQYAQTIRALNTLQASDDETYIPAGMRQQFAFRVPEFMQPYLGIDPNSESDAFFRDIDLPGVDVLSLFSPSNTLSGSVRETLFNVINQMTPLARAPLELGLQQDFFSRRPIAEAETPLDRLYMSVFKSPRPLDPVLRTAINMIPGLQRPISLAGGLADERLTWPQRGIKQSINQLTGIKRQDVPPEWRDADLQRAASGMLKDWTRSKVISSVPDELMPFMPPELVPYELLRRQKAREATARNRKRDEEVKRQQEQAR